ncbi:hypothetical protein D3C76_1538460 [compost metagenome]
MYISFKSLGRMGEKGVTYGTPKLFNFVRWIQINRKNNMVPSIPRIAAKSMPTKRSRRKVMPALYVGIENEEMAVTATTITRKGLTIPAFTAASPITKPPTMPIAGPMGLGNRMPASRRISIEISRIMTSMTEGKGTP